MPHIKGESYTDLNTTYKYIYSNYLPVEFFCNGIISACLTFINVMCIFITAIMVLKVRAYPPIIILLRSCSRTYKLLL